MNRIIIVTLSLFVGLSLSEQSKGDMKFNRFLQQFAEIELPFNYKEELSKVRKGGTSLSYISDEYSRKYLDMTDIDLFSKRLIYDYETFEKHYVTEQNLPASHFRFESDDYIAVIYRHGKGIDNDTVEVYLRIFSKNGEFIDETIIGEQFSRENDFISSVFVNKSQFKIFRYELNLENYSFENNIYQIKNMEQPKTTLTIEEYIIDKSGNIQMVKRLPKQYLHESIIEYKTYNPETDDPMNLY